MTGFECPADQSEAVKAERARCGQGYFDKYAASGGGKGENIMGIRIGHASISENGTTSGKAGDQTGKEVCIREWYSKHPRATRAAFIVDVVQPLEPYVAPDPDATAATF